MYVIYVGKVVFFEPDVHWVLVVEHAADGTDGALEDASTNFVLCGVDNNRKGA